MHHFNTNVLLCNSIFVFVVVLCLTWGKWLADRGTELHFATRITGYWRCLSSEEVSELIQIDEKYTTSDFDWRPNVAYPEKTIVRMNYDALEEREV